MTDVTCAPYAGWERCLHVRHNDITLTITLDVGPRILSCRFGDKPNLFCEFPDQLGKLSADEYMLFGGHRLWHAPEAEPRSYCPDFDPVEFEWQDPVLRLVQVPEQTTRIQKELELHFQPGNRVLVRHKLSNRGLWPVELAPWAATLMAPASRGIIPQEEYRPHPETLDPARSITLWHYTQMNDPRVYWGSRFIELREDSSIEQKIKFGALNRQGWAASWNHQTLFIKSFAFDNAATYADMGCNFETFTMPGFLEIESLGPLAVLEPQATVSHDEIWHLWSCETLPDTRDEEALAVVLKPYLAELEMPAA